MAKQPVTTEWWRWARALIRVLVYLVIVCLILWIVVSVFGKYITIGISEEDVKAHHPSAVVAHDPETSPWPMTVTTGFGDVVIPARPTRIVALSNVSADNLVSVDITPVGIPDLTGRTASGAAITPWLNEALSIQKPTLLEVSGDVLPYDAVTALNPDLILAIGANLRIDQYRTLSRIAPTISALDSTGDPLWMQSEQIVGAVTGRTKQSTRSVSTTQELLATTKNAHPEFAGTTVAITSIGGDNAVTLLYGSHPTADIFSTLGFSIVGGSGTDPMESSPVLEASRLVTWEEVNALNPDLVVTWFDSDSHRAATENDPAFASLRAVHTGHVMLVQSADVSFALDHPTTLNMPWLMSNVLPLLKEAMAGHMPTPAATPVG